MVYKITKTHEIREGLIMKKLELSYEVNKALVEIETQYYLYGIKSPTLKKNTVIVIRLTMILHVC